MIMRIALKYNLFLPHGEGRNIFLPPVWRPPLDKIIGAHNRSLFGADGAVFDVHLHIVITMHK